MPISLYNNKYRKGCVFYMKVLAVNAGSSSMKFQLFNMPEEEVLVSSTFERIGLDNSFYSIKINDEKIKKEAYLDNHKTAVEIFLKELLDNGIVNDLEEIEGVGHRVLHGFDKYSEPVIVTEEVMNDIDKFSVLGPLHNPANLLGIKAIKAILPNSINVAIFDTAFHQTMPRESYIYPVPYEWYEKYGVRKYGFHGTSHKYLSKRAIELLNNEHSKVIICHLGNGGSLTAVKDGKCVDTTMGLTPLAGIPMGTRCGDIDVSIIQYIMHQTGKTIEEITNDLNKKSGFLGISGISSDSRDIEEGITSGNERCILSQKIYVNKIVSFIAYYNVLLGGADAIVFSAGIGENGIATRKEIIDMLSPIGVFIDEERNNIRGKEALISREDSKIKCYVIPTNEELMIARDTFNLSK
jgi:acetate kinase